MWVSCKNCKEEFETKPALIKIGKGKYCSRKCYLEVTSNAEERVCLNCGKISMVAKSQRKKRLCCSKECLKQYKLKVGEWKAKTPQICKQCGKEFESPGHRLEKFCSHDCYHKSCRVTEEHKKLVKLLYTRKYRKEHPSWAASMKHKRRALEAEFGGNFSPVEWDLLKHRHHSCCAICGRHESERKLTVDHKIPIAKWGKWAKEFKPTYKWNDIQNIQPLCGKCNSGKAAYL